MIAIINKDLYYDDLIERILPKLEHKFTDDVIAQIKSADKQSMDDFQVGAGTLIRLWHLKRNNVMIQLMGDK